MQEPKSPRRRHRKATKTVEARQPKAIFFPYSQCMCDLANSIYNPYVQSKDDLVDLENYYSGAPLPPERFVPLIHDNGVITDHLPECPQLHTAYSKTSKTKTSKKARSHGREAPYLDDEEEKEKAKARKQKKDARRQKKEAKRFRDAEAKVEARKAGNLVSSGNFQCYCYDALSDSEEDAIREEARTVCNTHTDGTTSFHLPNCLTKQSATTRKIYTSTPKPKLSIGREEKETAEARKKTKSTGRKSPKSAAYIFSDGEEEGDDPKVASLAVERYDPRTIASDILRAIGHHPYLPPLNAHIEGYSTKKKGRAPK